MTIQVFNSGCTGIADFAIHHPKMFVGKWLAQNIPFATVINHPLLGVTW